MGGPDYDSAVFGYVLVAILGFVIGALGNLYGSRLMIGLGIAMIYAGVVGLPIYGYLTR